MATAYENGQGFAFPESTHGYRRPDSRPLGSVQVRVREYNGVHLSALRIGTDTYNMGRFDCVEDAKRDVDILIALATRTANPKNYLRKCTPSYFECEAFLNRRTSEYASNFEKVENPVAMDYIHGSTTVDGVECYLVQIPFFGFEAIIGQYHQLDEAITACEHVFKLLNAPIMNRNDPETTKVYRLVLQSEGYEKYLLTIPM